MLKGIHQQLDPQVSPAFFIQGPRPFSRLMFFCTLSLVMMAVDARFDYLSKVRQGFSAALHPLEVVASAPNEWGRNLYTYFTSHNQLIQDNFKLRQQALIDRAALQRLATLDAENAHLRTLLAGDAPVIPHATLGEVLHMGRDPFSNIITLNRGSRHQIAAGQAVVDEQGVVGQITRVYPFTSEVTLITDKKLSIPIQIERNQLRAIAFGEGKRHTLDIPYLPTSVDIKVGDKLVTSGIDGVYPAGLAVAVVTQIKQSQDSPFAKIISRPIAGVNNHKHVLILRMPDAPATAPTPETRQLLPRNSAQHLDQSVVEILQKNNAAVDPHPVTTPPALDTALPTPAEDSASPIVPSPASTEASAQATGAPAAATASSSPTTSSTENTPAAAPGQPTTAAGATTPTTGNTTSAVNKPAASSTPPYTAPSTPAAKPQARPASKPAANASKKARTTPSHAAVKPSGRTLKPQASAHLRPMASVRTSQGRTQ